MRAWIVGCAALFGSAGAFAEEPRSIPPMQLRTGSGSIGPADAAGTELLRRSAEAAARQDAVERRIAERNRRAARMICAGCAGNPQPAARGRRAAVPLDRDAERDNSEAHIVDPAQAPLD